MRRFGRADAWQAARFAVTGVGNTLLDITGFTLLVKLAHLPAPAANVISYGSCVLLSFIINSLWTFRAGFGAGAHRRLVLFVAVNLSALALSTAIVAGLAHPLTPLMAKLISVPATFVWNYLLSRALVFRRTAASDA